MMRFRDTRKAGLDAAKVSRGCDRCGYNASPAALDYHHRDPESKLFHVTRQTATVERIAAEIAKCDLLCANCHRELHHADHPRRKSRDPQDYPGGHKASKPWTLTTLGSPATVKA